MLTILAPTPAAPIHVEALTIAHDPESMDCRERTCKCGRALLAAIGG